MNGPPVDGDATSRRRPCSAGGRSSDGDGLADRLRDAWPYRVFDALPRPTVFVNNARDRATVAEALSEQTPLARELRPDIVEVWLGADDVAAGTPLPEFTRELAAPRRAGCCRRAEPSRRRPARRVRRHDRARNAAIHRVARDDGAELVALAGARIALGSPREGRLPDAASQRVIADAFAAVIKARA